MRSSFSQLIRIKVRRASRFLRNLVCPICDNGRETKMLPEVWNVLQKIFFVTKGNVIEKDQMMMDLTHVPDMRYDLNRGLS